MRNERAWPQQCWKNGSSPFGEVTIKYVCIVALRFSDHGTKKMLGAVGWKVWPVSNFAQQHATTCNRVCKRTQHVTSNNVAPVCEGLNAACKRTQHCWPTTPNIVGCYLLRPFAFFISRSRSLSPFFSLSWASLACRLFFSVFVLQYIPNLWTWQLI